MNTRETCVRYRCPQRGREKPQFAIIYRTRLLRHVDAASNDDGRMLFGSNFISDFPLFRFGDASNAQWR